MPKTSRLQATVNLEVPPDVSGEVQGLWVHVVAPGANDKTLAKAKVDRNGKATVKFQMPGDKPSALEVIVSPLSTIAGLKRVKTEKGTLAKWQKQGDMWTADASIKLTPGFFAAVAWLDEAFTVEGVIVNRYDDPQTELPIETPIRHAMVKLFDVDRVAKFKPPWCIPIHACIPQTVCKPQILCLPDVMCNPTALCNPVKVCLPVIGGEICTPSTAGPCGPWVQGPVDPGQWQEVVSRRAELQKLGCCGSDTPEIFQGLARKNVLPVMKPLKSPSLTEAAKEIQMKNVLQCLPLNMPVCSPIGITMSGFKKTALGDECETDDSGHFWFTFTRKDFFEAIAGSTHTEDKDWDEYPDLLFQARLWIDGEFRFIYDEPYSDTRWNAGTYKWVKLVVQGQLPGCDPSDSGIDLGQTEDFLFHNVGDVEPGWIGSDGIIHSAPAATGLNDHVFGGGMEIFAQFQVAHISKYYQVEFQRDGTSDWHPVLGEQWYYSHYLGAGMWETKLKAPESFTGYPACYQIPDYTDYTITRKNQLITWQSYRMDGNVARYPDGLYHFRVQLLQKTGPTSLVPVAGFDPNANILHMTIDNHWPTAEVDPTLYLGTGSGGVLNISPVAECGFVQRGTGRYLILHFMADDPENHFLSYRITVNRGADQAIVIPASGLSPGTTTNPALPGFTLSPASYTYQAPADNFPNAYTAMGLANDPWLGGGQPLKQCAYNFTLEVRDRVTNGYGYIHWTYHTLTLTITA